jgi:hypothetical protein
MQALQKEETQHGSGMAEKEQEIEYTRVANSDLAKQLVREKNMRQRSVDAIAERLKKVEQDLEKAIEAQYDVEVELQELKKEGRERIAIREEGGRGKPVSDTFVRHARTLLSTGGSARSTLEQLHLNAAFILSEKEYALFMADVPSLRWFQYHREGLGLESYLYTLMRIAKCERVLQWGFDETSLDGVATLKQWVRIEEAGDVHVLTLECAGLLTGGTAQGRRTCESLLAARTTSVGHVTGADGRTGGYVRTSR